MLNDPRIILHQKANYRQIKLFENRNTYTYFEMKTYETIFAAHTRKGFFKLTQKLQTMQKRLKIKLENKKIMWNKILKKIKV